MSGQKTRTEKLKQKNGNLHLQLCQDNKRHDDDDDHADGDDDDDDGVIEWDEGVFGVPSCLSSAHCWCFLPPDWLPLSKLPTRTKEFTKGQIFTNLI